MVKTVVWHHYVGRSGACDPRPFLNALSTAGIGAIPLAAQDPVGPGILFFDEITLSLLECLREISRMGLERVLAIALSRGALVDGGAWRLLQHGASDVLAWDDTRNCAAEVAARLERWEEVDQLVASPLVRDNLIGRSPPWVGALRRLVEAARYTNAPILLLGETGTGKELASRVVHALDTRPRKGELVLVDCGTVAPELSGSEFFGHTRGAFTGAIAARDGAFAMADGGTLFLDEIGELPLRLQAELLRAVQERTFKRLGSNAWQQTSFRLVSATNRCLPDEVQRGQFRRDLYYRIAGVTITLPPLRDRPEDILPLIRHFMAQLRPTGPLPEIDEVVADYLVKRPYEGNVRDLRQLVAAIMHRHVGAGPITAGDLPVDERPAGDIEVDWRDVPFATAIRRAVAQGVGLREIGHAATETAIQVAVEIEGNLQSAARKLGVTDRALQIRRAAKRKHPMPSDEVTAERPELHVT
jgi:transcriptional regulator with GAF, ATPase, and Fis domain